MKILCFLALFSFSVSTMAQRVDNISDSYHGIQKITLKDLSHELLETPSILKKFLDGFFRDFTAHQKTKITKLTEILDCEEGFCYRLNLDYYYYSKDKEKNIDLDCDLVIKFFGNRAEIEIKNNIPLAIKTLIKVSPAAWIDDFPIMKRAVLKLVQHDTGLDLYGRVETQNQVSKDIMKEFLDDLLSSFYFHLQEISKSL